MSLTEDDLFTSGDFEPVGTVTYRLTFLNTLWMLKAVMYALTLMCDEVNWNTVGTLTPEQCESLAVQMMEEFNPVVPTVGTCIPFAGAELPDGALWCDGESYLRIDYAALFDTIGAVFGSVDGTHFNVPDLRNRTVVARGGAHNTLGAAFGEDDHVLSVSELPAHHHTVANFATALIVPAGVVPVTIPNVIIPLANTSDTGGNVAHNNDQPSLTLNYIILTR